MDMTRKPRTYYYKYSALPEDSIRLLKILSTCSPESRVPQQASSSPPDSGLEKQVKIELEIFPLSSCPAYTALSYTWGPSGSLSSDQPDKIFTQVASCFPIICDGLIILGTKNLRDAMRAIRYGIDRTLYSEGLTDEQRESMASLFRDVSYVWIDAVCIDQTNLTERNHQVRLMSQIYKRAHQTFVWLGQKDRLSDAGTAVLSKVLANVTFAQEESGRLGGQGVPVKPLNLSSSDKKACAAILTRNWFSRYWILQEALLSREVIVLIGTRVTSFLAYERARTLAQLAGFFFSEVGPPDVMSNVGTEMQAHETIATLSFMEECRDEIRQGRLPSFMTVMNMCRVQQCFDPRDRIYSILGLCREFSDDEGILFQPDYTKSVEEVFLEGTMFIIDSRKDLAVLNLVRHDSHSYSLPSWCPDYRSLQGTLVTTVYQDDTRAWQLADNSFRTISVTSKHLILYGQRIGVIQEVAGLMEFQNSGGVEGSSMLAYEGVCGSLSLLTRLDVASVSTTTRLQTLGRVDLFWHTIMSSMFSCFRQLAGWTTRPLPDGAGLLLPQLIRSLLSYEQTVYNSQNDTEKLNKGIVHLEAILAELVSLESEKAHFLPEPREFIESFDPDIADAAVHLHVEGLKKCREDHKLLRQKATELNLYLPPGFTSKPLVNLSNDRYDDFYLNQAFSWLIGFVNALRRLSDAALFRTEKQTLGMARCNPQVHDEIWILNGAYAPVCLRPSTDGNYRFIGEVYIHEIMNGEAVQACNAPIQIMIE